MVSNSFDKSILHSRQSPPPPFFFKKKGRPYMIIIAIWGPRAPAIGYQCVYHMYNYIIKHVVEVIDLILIKIYLVKSC